MYHLEQLRMLLLPTQVTKMCMWSLHQDDEFYDEEKNQTSWGGGIWNILCKELNVRGATHACWCCCGCYCVRPAGGGCQREPWCC